MAIAATYRYPEGTVHIDDDCYRDVSEEEMARRIARAQQAALEILQNERIRREREEHS